MVATGAETSLIHRLETLTREVDFSLLTIYHTTIGIQNPDADLIPCSLGDAFQQTPSFARASSAPALADVFSKFQNLTPLRHYPGAVRYTCTEDFFVGGFCGTRGGVLRSTSCWLRGSR